MEESGLFEIKEESKLTDIVALINEPFTYDNMVNNPIIKLFMNNFTEPKWLTIQM